MSLRVQRGIVAFLARSQEPAYFSLVEDDFSEWEVTNGTITNILSTRIGVLMDDDIWTILYGDWED